MDKQYITDDVRITIEKALKNGDKIEMRLKKNKDGTEELIIFKSIFQKVNIEKTS